jgi:hypothetical protein
MSAPVARFLFLPLSWRHPDVVCAATAAACYGFAHYWRQNEPPAGWEFVLCDRDDPSPFLRFLRNEDDCLGKFIGRTWILPSFYYHRRPIREVPAGPLLPHVVR